MKEGVTHFRAGRGYFACVDVLPLDVCEIIYIHLGEARKITFGATGRKFTKTEELLPELLVHKCREILDNLELTNRTVLFSKYKPREVPRHIAYALAKFAIDNGCTLHACAAALGYHYNTIVQWGIRKGSHAWFDPPALPGYEGTKAADLLVVGRSYCAGLEGARDYAPNAAHYAWVGWVRWYVTLALENMRRFTSDLAAAGGPIEAAEAIYHLPKQQLAPLGRWRPPSLQGKPPMDEDFTNNEAGALAEYARLKQVGRTYCDAQAHPVVARHLAWVGWFYEHTATTPAPSTVQPEAPPKQRRKAKSP